MKDSFSISGWLYRLGTGIRFCPSVSFAPPVSAEEKTVGKRFSRLLPYARKVKTALSKMAEQSAILNILRSLIRRFFATRIRSFAVFFFSCGFFRIVSYFLFSFLPGYEANEANLLFGVGQIFLTLICSFSRGDVSDVLKRSLFFRSVLRRLFGVRDWQIPAGKSRDDLVGMLLIGLGTGALSLVVSPVRIAGIALLAAVILFVFFSPEAGLVIAGAGLFFFPRVQLFAILILTLISFAAKCCVGKRSLVFSPMDPVVLLFLLPFFSGEIPDGGAFLFFSFFLLYFLASNLLRTLAGLHRLLAALSAGSAFLALMLVLRQGIAVFFPALFSRVEGLEELFFVQPSVENGILIAMTFPPVLGRLCLVC